MSDAGSLAMRQLQTGLQSRPCEHNRNQVYDSPSGAYSQSSGQWSDLSVGPARECTSGLRSVPAETAGRSSKKPSRGKFDIFCEHEMLQACDQIA